MKLGRLNHVGIAVPDMTAALAFWRDVMGAVDVTEPFDMPAQGVRVAFVNPVDGGTQVELVAPLNATSPLHGFLQRNPQGGQHHLAFEVEDIHAAHAYFTGIGKRVLGDIRLGAHGTPVFFLHPRDMAGVLTEVMERPRGHD